MIINYAFFGTPEFSRIILEKLIQAKMLPAVVICNPDRPSGREKIIIPPPTKIIAEKNSIKVLQPKELDAEKLKSEIEKPGGLNLAIVAAYAKIIPKEILNLLPNKFLGVHPSLLPKYRGATPIQSVIVNNEKTTGVTLYLLNEKMDNGPILTQSELEISKKETYESLHNKLANLSAELLIKTLSDFAENKIIPKSQNHAQASFTKKINTEDAFINYQSLIKAQEKGGEIAKEIDRKIRAFNPEPGTWTLDNEQKRIKLLESEIKNDKLELKKIQKEGKKPIYL